MRSSEYRRRRQREVAIDQATSHRAAGSPARTDPVLFPLDHASPALLRAFEDPLAVHSYGVRHFAGKDENFDYSRGPELHSDGAYEIELVIEKIEPPAWDLA